MATNIDTGLTVADAVNADHSPHIFTMSNGDLVVIYYDGTNLVWRSKSGGAWSAKTTITLDTGVTPPQVSYLTRNGDTIFANVSKDPIDSSHNADWFELTYTTSTHTLAQTSKQVDAGDGNEKAAGIGYISGATANNQVQMLHGNAAGNFCTIQQINVNPTIVGTDVSPTFGDLRSSARTGLVTDGATTTYLMYACASTGTAFKVERAVTTSASTTVESPPAPAANPAGIAGVYDGTDFVFIANENNAKLRYLTRTGANTYGSWTDILSDASLTGQPAVCVKSSTGDLAVFYRTNKNQANGEIWCVQRTSGTWGSASLVAGGAATGWSNPSCAASDLNDTGVARVVYVTGTASTWTLVEDSVTFGGGVTTSTRNVPASAALLATNTRNVPASAALVATPTRTVPASAALLATNTRNAPASAALLATNTRAIASSAALLATGLQRSAPASAALLQPDLARAIPTSAALLGTPTRAIPASAALLATNTRAVPSSAALLATDTRQVPASAALMNTLTRSVPASVQLGSGLTRTVPASAALLATIQRAIPATAALIQPNIQRAVPASAALVATHTRAAPASAALLATMSRATPASAALLQTLSRQAFASVALLASSSRAIAASVGLFVPGEAPPIPAGISASLSSGPAGVSAALSVEPSGVGVSLSAQPAGVSATVAG